MVGINPIRALTPAEIVAAGPDAASVSGDAGCKLDCRPLKDP